MNILYEDNHLIAVNKPAGVLVHTDSTGDRSLQQEVKKYIKKKYNKPGAVFLNPTHRIDRPTSGVVLFARTSKALERMNRLFANREVKKTYWAVTKVRPYPLEGMLSDFLWKDTTKNKTKVLERPSNRHKNAKRAELNYKLLAEIDGHSLLEVIPTTGRSHQIRAQLSAHGSPIIGDLKYGYPKANNNASIHLHSRSLAFVHPVKKTPILIEGDPPKDMIWNWFGNFF